MKLTLSGCSKDVTLQDIKKVEEKINYSFDKSYLDLILFKNGGSPSKFLYESNDEVFSFHMFLPIKYDGVIESLEKNYFDLVKEDFYPSWLVPFAIDGGGDFYGFSKKECEIGSIYCFMMDYYDDENEALVKIADSFSDLIERMYEE